MKSKTYITGLCMILSMGIVGCSFDPGAFIMGVTSDKQLDSGYVGDLDDAVTDNGVSEQTTSNHIPIDDGTKDYDVTTHLESGRFYIKHGEEYYPLYTYDANFTLDGDSSVSPVNSSRQLYYTTSVEDNIPTLFIGQGDTLVYFDTSNILDYIYWDRYYDMGYYIGIHNIQSLESGRLYINISEGSSIVKGTELSVIPDEIFTDIVYLYKLGSAELTSDLLTEGLIGYTDINTEYDLELYDGTYYNHYLTSPNVHVYKSYENYLSIEYTPLQSYLYEVAIPDYLIDGYYRVQGNTSGSSYYDGMFRLVHEKSYINDPKNFNEPLLYQYEVLTEDDERYEAWKDWCDRRNKPDYDPSVETYVEQREVIPAIAPARYSIYDSDSYSGDIANRYYSEVPDTLGYVDPYAEIKEEQDKKAKIILKSAQLKTFAIEFPAVRRCVIKITPKNMESTGDCYVITGENSKRSLTYNKLSGAYTLEMTGDGNTYELVVSGLYSDYDIELTNAKQGDIENILYHKSHVIDSTDDILSDYLDIKNDDTDNSAKNKEAEQFVKDMESESDTAAEMKEDDTVKTDDGTGDYKTYTHEIAPDSLITTKDVATMYVIFNDKDCYDVNKTTVMLKITDSDGEVSGYPFDVSDINKNAWLFGLKDDMLENIYNKLYKYEIVVYSNTDYEYGVE